MFLNLLRGDWLARLSPAVELGSLALVGAAFGFALVFLRRWRCLLLSLVGSGAMAVIAYLLFALAQVWFAWLIGIAQITVAVLWSLSIPVLPRLQTRPMPQPSLAKDSVIWN